MTTRGTAPALAPLVALALVARRPLRRAVVRASVDAVVWGLDDVAESDGPFVFAANHPSALDGPLLRSVLEPVIGPVAVASVAGGSGGSSARGSGGRRGGAVSLAAARLTLRAGRSVVVFAEEDRADDGALRDFGTAAARLARDAGVPLVPVAIDGTFAALPPWRALPVPGRPRVTVTFARPIPTGASDEPTGLAQVAERAVRTAVAGTRGPWFDAHRTHAGPVGSDASDSPSGDARWRRIWDSTSRDTRSARRRTWR
jgi:1-acyl-sn-glycerol-3-phosphate acyltransferase